MISQRAISIPTGAGAIALALVLMTGTASHASTGKDQERSSFLSSSCASQVREAASAVGVSERGVAAATARLCQGRVVSAPGVEQVATVAEVRSFALSRNLPRAAVARLTAQAEEGWISYREWSQTYETGRYFREVHTGRTYFDATDSWVQTHRETTGSHDCHTPGSLSWFGPITTVQQCTQPVAGPVADSLYEFEVNTTVFGVPIAFTVGMHTSVSYGAVQQWVVDGAA